MSPSVSPELLSDLDNKVRLGLQQYSDTFFNAIVFSALVVAFGCALEGPEILHDIFPKLFSSFTWPSKDRLDRFERKVKKWGLVGWLLIVLGLASEGFFEVFDHRASGLVQTFDELLVADTQREAAKTYERAAVAMLEAQDAKIGAQGANERASKNERTAAELSLEATQEQADNLVMQKVLAPRQLGFPGTIPQYTWFSETRDFPGMDVYIQSASDKEAKNLAGAIALELDADDKWNVHWVDEKESHVSLEMMEGIDLWGTMERNPRGPWKNHTEWAETSERLGKACWALARALTFAGFGTGDRPLGCSMLGPRFTGDLRKEGVAPLPGWAWLDPPRNGVYIQVGLRPISATVQWLNAKREERAKKQATTNTKP